MDWFRVLFAYVCFICIPCIFCACTGTEGGNPNNATIGLAGGTIKLPDGASVEVPEGAVKEPTKFTFSADDASIPAEYSAYSKPYRLTPAGFQFAEPVRVTIPHHGDGSRALAYWSSTGLLSDVAQVPGENKGDALTFSTTSAGAGFIGTPSCIDTNTCTSSPCDLIMCNAPSEAPRCVDSMTSRSFVGTCDASTGSCSYAPIDSTCVIGCDEQAGICRTTEVLNNAQNTLGKTPNVTCTILLDELIAVECFKSNLPPPLELESLTYTLAPESVEQFVAWYVVYEWDGMGVPTNQVARDNLWDPILRQPGEHTFNAFSVLPKLSSSNFCVGVNFGEARGIVFVTSNIYEPTGRSFVNRCHQGFSPGLGPGNYAFKATVRQAATTP